MRLPTYLVQSPTGVFHFRWVVPKGWRERAGCKVVKRSLGTRNARVAQVYALTLVSRYIQSLGGSTMGNDALEDALRRAKHGRQFEITRLKGGGYRVKTDGTPEDNQAAFGTLSLLTEADKAQLARAAPAARTEPPLPPPAPVATVVQIDTDEAIRMWWLTLPKAKPSEVKDSNSRLTKVREFYDWKRSRMNKSFAVSAISRTDVAECFVYSKSTNTERGTLPAPRYLENKFLVLAGFLDWAQTSDYFPAGENPARGHAAVAKKVRKRRAKTHGWQAFSAAQVKRIFDPKTFVTIGKEQASRWIAVMALYTGARSNELAHLELEDCYDFDGRQPVFDFNFLGPHKSLKTDASERKTPVHPDLIALGLWKRVERLRAAGESKLFPDLNFAAQNGPANAAQRAFTRYLERLNIEARGDGQVGLHSFRDTAIQTMKLAGVREEYRREYCGHEQSGNDDHHDAYGIDLLPTGLAKQCHPALAFGLDLEALGKLLG